MTAWGADGRPWGVYVHLPFCARRCDYCAFATWTDRSHLMDRYVDAVVAHAERVLTEVGAATGASTVFIGGGTPSLVPPAGIRRLLAAVPRAGDAEVTMEANPDTVTAERLAGYRDAGVNRLSLGVQSMVPHVLAALGRTHQPESVARAVAAARTVGFDTFNVDLIYGAAGERIEDWRRSLDGALALDPPHVSAYALTVEPGTPLAADGARHPDGDDQADKYHLAADVLAEAGLDWYEISNWARPGHACRHNQLYWSQGDYLALGCAAHGHRQGRRWWNVRTPERYIAAVVEGRDPEAGSEVLDAALRRSEGWQLALRTRSGVPADALADDDPALEGLVARHGDRRVLTAHGRLLANEVALRLR